jgi:hypothetical protein
MSVTSALRSFLVAVGIVSTVLVGFSAAELSASSDDASVTAGISISKKRR